jgi:hypothetical protein
MAFVCIICAKSSLDSTQVLMKCPECDVYLCSDCDAVVICTMTECHWTCRYHSVPLTFLLRYMLMIQFFAEYTSVQVHASSKFSLHVRKPVAGVLSEDAVSVVEATLAAECNDMQPSKTRAKCAPEDPGSHTDASSDGHLQASNRKGEAAEVEVEEEAFFLIRWCPSITPQRNETWVLRKDELTQLIGAERFTPPYVPFPT